MQHFAGEKFDLGNADLVGIYQEKMSDTAETIEALSITKRFASTGACPSIACSDICPDKDSHSQPRSCRTDGPTPTIRTAPPVLAQQARALLPLFLQNHRSPARLAVPPSGPNPLSAPNRPTAQLPLGTGCPRCLRPLGLHLTHQRLGFLAPQPASDRPRRHRRWHPNLARPRSS